MKNTRAVLMLLLVVVAVAVTAAQSLAGNAPAATALGGDLDWTAALLVAAGGIPLAITFCGRRESK